MTTSPALSSKDPLRLAWHDLFYDAALVWLGSNGFKLRDMPPKSPRIISVLTMRISDALPDVSTTRIRQWLKNEAVPSLEDHKVLLALFFSEKVEEQLRGHVLDAFKNARPVLETAYTDLTAKTHEMAMSVLAAKRLENIPPDSLRVMPRIKRRSIAIASLTSQVAIKECLTFLQSMESGEVDTATVSHLGKYMQLLRKALELSLPECEKESGLSEVALKFLESDTFPNADTLRSTQDRYLTYLENKVREQDAKVALPVSPKISAHFDKPKYRKRLFAVEFPEKQQGASLGGS